MKAGEVIASKYKLTSRIGQGGMGSVWRATNTATGREFAIKFLHASVAGSDDSRSRFLQEARASAKVNHPNAIDIFDVGETEDGGLYLVMELLDGISLADALRSEPPFSARDLLMLLSEACTALHAAHAAGIVHRDLKPPNIFLHRDRATGFVVAKVVDFGVSKLTNDDGVGTTTGSLLGSPRYMSPEQAVSAASADGRSDVWSLGVVLFESLTGRFPHDGDSTNSLIVAIATQPPKVIEAVAPQLPASLRMLVNDCLRPVGMRIQTVGLLLDRMLSILATEDVSQLPLAKPTVARGKLRARPDGMLVRTTPGMIPGLQTSMLKEQGLGNLARHLRDPHGHPSQASVAAVPAADWGQASARGTVRLAAYQPAQGSQPQLAARPSHPSVPGHPYAQAPSYGAFASQQMPQQLAPSAPYGQTVHDPMAESISSMNVAGARVASGSPPSTSSATSRRGGLVLAVGVAALAGAGLLVYRAMPTSRSASASDTSEGQHASQTAPVPTDTDTPRSANPALAPSVAPLPVPSAIPAASARPSAAPPRATSAVPTAPAQVRTPAPVRPVVNPPVPTRTDDQKIRKMPTGLDG